MDVPQNDARVVVNLRRPIDAAVTAAVLHDRSDAWRARAVDEARRSERGEPPTDGSSPSLPLPH